MCFYVFLECNAILIYCRLVYMYLYLYLYLYPGIFLNISYKKVNIYGHTTFLKVKEQNQSRKVLIFASSQRHDPDADTDPDPQEQYQSRSGPQTLMQIY
jgi:hypothetical protein